MCPKERFLSLCGTDRGNPVSISGGGRYSPVVKRIPDSIHLLVASRRESLSVPDTHA